MKKVSKNISKISAYLQSLTAPEYSKKVEVAIKKKDQESLVAVCRNAKIPNQYLGTIVSVLFSMGVSPEQQQKYPEFM